MAEDTIQVKSTLPKGPDGGFPVAVWDPEQPDDVCEGGEVFIGDDRVYTVAETPRILGALREGKIVKVTASGKPAKE